MSFLPEASKNEMDKLRYSCVAWDGGSPGVETKVGNSLNGQRGLSGATHMR